MENNEQVNNEQENKNFDNDLIESKDEDIDAYLKKIEEHYSKVPTLDNREESKIYQLRILNNIIKTLLIRKYIVKYNSVVDFCCGKGGDLQKFKKAGVSHVLFVDITKASLEELEDRIQSSRVIFTHQIVQASVVSETLLDEVLKAYIFSQSQEENISDSDYIKNGPEKASTLEFQDNLEIISSGNKKEKTDFNEISEENRKVSQVSRFVTDNEKNHPSLLNKQAQPERSPNESEKEKNENVTDSQNQINDSISSNDGNKALLDVKNFIFQSFDVINAQFCFNYLVGNSESANTFFKSCNKLLKPSGKILITCTDKEVIKSFYEEKGRDGCLKNDHFKLQFANPKQLDPQELMKEVFREKFGTEYVFYLKEAVEEMSEFLIPEEILEEIATNQGFEKIMEENFVKFFVRECISMGYKKMKGFYLYLFKSLFVNEDQGEGPENIKSCNPKIETQIWEIFRLYKVLVFEKKDEIP